MTVKSSFFAHSLSTILIFAGFLFTGFNYLTKHHLSSVKQTVLVQFFTRNFQIYKKGYPQTPKFFIYTS